MIRLRDLWFFKKKKSVSDVSFVGKRATDMDAFCWNVSEKEYSKIMGAVRVKLEKDSRDEMVAELEEEVDGIEDKRRFAMRRALITQVVWRIYPNSVTGNLDPDKNYRFRIIVEEI